MFDEQEIVRRCLKNERKAQKILFEHFAPGLLGVCIRYTSSRAEAEDILQDGFVKVFKYLKDFEGRSSLAAWMRRIMVNTAITHYHKNLKHHYHLDINDVNDQKMGDCDLSDLDFTKEEMMKVIDDLPRGYRMVFNLYAIEGYKHKEIAEQMGIDENTSKSQYSRARKLIQCRLAALAKEKQKRQEDNK
jgi:RNA polymerase sigma-70 factor (ECF subfamily)